MLQSIKTNNVSSSNSFFLFYFYFLIRKAWWILKNKNIVVGRIIWLKDLTKRNLIFKLPTHQDRVDACAVVGGNGWI